MNSNKCKKQKTKQNPKVGHSIYLVSLGNKFYYTIHCEPLKHILYFHEPNTRILNLSKSLDSCIHISFCLIKKKFLK